MIFLIVILVQQIFGFSELIYSFDASIDGLQGWVGKSYIFNEHNVKLYGGNSPTIRRIFLNLNPHYQIKIEMEFWLTNNQSSGSLQMQIDDLLILNKLYNNATLVDVNGPTHFDQYYDVITIVQPQKRRTAFLQIVITELIQCGIRTLKFYIERCPLECEVCDNFDYLDCYKWKLYKLAFNQYQFQNLQGWSTKIERTFQTINFCAQCHFLNQEGVNFNGVLPSHKGIILRFFRLGTLISQTININGYINTIAQSTQSSLIELIIKNHYEVNLFISIQTASIRDFEFYYQLEDQYSIPLMLNCHQYINSICVNCLDGWELNEFQNLCNPYCGNQIIQDLEQCDDGNEIPNDGCFQCQFQCDIHCAICYFGICQKCEIGYLIANDQNIFPQCLLEIIDSDEICINHCIVCYKNQCQECEEGFTLNNGDCKSICGDGIIISEYEQCDDGNQIEFDGCYQCKYSCPLLCSNCFQGICIQQNQEEDQNLISSINHYCGDGLVQDQEECDDQNLNPYDGCYNCKIQINWICSQINIYSLSECAYRKIPLLSVSYLNMKMNKQYIRVEYSKTVPSKDLVSISKIIQIKILDLNSKSYYLNLIPILEVGQDFQNLKYLIEIEIFQLLDFRPILAINFNQISKKYTRRTIEFPNEEDDNNAPLNNHLNLTLQYPSYLNSQQINNSNLITNINGYIIQFLGAITGIQLLFGKSNQFLLILNILSYQQYLRYINLQFPQNLMIYFDLYDLINIEPILNLLHFHYFANKIFIYSIKSSIGKFEYYNQNADLLTNLFSQILQSIGCLLIIIFIKLFKACVYKKFFNKNYFFCLYCCQYNPQFLFYFNKYLYKICKKMIKLGKYITLQGLKNILLINGWDLIFKILLYVKSIGTYTSRDLTQIIFSMVILLCYFYIFLGIFNRISFKKLNQKKNSLNERFQLMNLIRQIMLIFFLIFIQSNSIYQIGMISLTSLLQLKLIYISRFIFSTTSLLTQLYVEGTVFVFTLTSFAYINDFNDFINQNVKQILGWFQMITLTSGFAIELISIAYENFQYLKKKYISKKQNNQIEKIIIQCKK